MFWIPLMKILLLRLSQFQKKQNVHFECLLPPRALCSFFDKVMPCLTKYWKMLMQSLMKRYMGQSLHTVNHKECLRNCYAYALSGFDARNALLRWVAAFLEGRTQFISLVDATSTARVLNGGIPQGTKLGPLLFAVTVNDLVSSWFPRAKYVDDLTVLEVVPRNSPSMLNFVVNEIESYAISNNMRLNPLKCKELSVDFLRYNSCSWQPIAVGGAFIKRVSCFKLLGVYISEDLSWASHCDRIIKRANRRLYALRVVKNCGLPMQDLLAVYCSLIRSILEYTSIVFANLPQYLSNALENIQKSSLGILLCHIVRHCIWLVCLPYKSAGKVHV